MNIILHIQSDIIEGADMIKDPEKFRNFEIKLLKKKTVDIVQKYTILEAMYKEAVMLGVFPLKNPMEGVENAIKVAKAVNSV